MSVPSLGMTHCTKYIQNKFLFNISEVINNKEDWKAIIISSDTYK